MTIISGRDEAISKFIKALGLDSIKNIQRITLNIVADDIVTVDVTHLVEDEELNELSEVLSEYMLAEREDKDNSTEFVGGIKRHDLVEVIKKKNAEVN